MEEKLQAALNKKSFELNYNGGKIWCEHLDGLGSLEKEVIDKFLNDRKDFSRPSVSSFMIINLDETTVTEEIAGCIVKELVDNKKSFRKIAFVGVHKMWKPVFFEIQKKTGAVISFQEDYEKAKEWQFGNY